MVCGWLVETDGRLGSVFIGGKSLVREGDSCTMNFENVEGSYVFANASKNVDPLLIAMQNEQVSEQDINLWAGPRSGGQIEKYQPKPVRRNMTSGELKMAKSVFGDAINFGEKGEGVGIYNGKWRPFQGDNRAMAPNGNIYFPGNAYKKDFSDLTLKNLSDANRRTFIHEMTHVWRYQHGKAVKSRGFALGVLSMIGDPYIYKLDTSKDLSDYGLEQQAAIVGDYYAVRENLNVRLDATNIKRPSLQDYEAVIGDNFNKPSPKVW